MLLVDVAPLFKLSNGKILGRLFSVCQESNLYQGKCILWVWYKVYNVYIKYTIYVLKQNFETWPFYKTTISRKLLHNKPGAIGAPEGQGPEGSCSLFPVVQSAIIYTLISIWSVSCWGSLGNFFVLWLLLLQCILCLQGAFYKIK